MSYAVTAIQKRTFYGLSTETKPVGPVARPSDLFYAVDSQITYILGEDQQTWYVYIAPLAL